MNTQTNAETYEDLDPRRASGNVRLALVGLLAVQALIGYEWLISGLTKIVRGGFPSGLADELREKSEGTVSWYKAFLDGTVIPNASTFGYLIEITELLIGAALIGAVVIWLFAWSRLSVGWQVSVLGLTLLAAVAGVVMNVNFHLANGSAHPWLIPKEGFDEGVDLDSLMPAIQLAVAAVSGGLLLRLRRSRRARPAKIGSPERAVGDRHAATH